jgi:hypothetical protein
MPATLASFSTTVKETSPPSLRRLLSNSALSSATRKQIEGNTREVVHLVVEFLGEF